MLELPPWLKRYGVALAAVIAAIVFLGNLVSVMSDAQEASEEKGVGPAIFWALFFAGVTIAALAVIAYKDNRRIKELEKRLAENAKPQAAEPIALQPLPIPAPAKPIVRKVGPRARLIDGIKIYADSFEWLMIAKRDADNWDHNQVFHWLNGANSKAGEIRVWARQQEVPKQFANLVHFPSAYSAPEPNQSATLFELFRKNGFEEYSVLHRHTFGLKQAIIEMSRANDIDLSILVSICGLDGVAIRLLPRPPAEKDVQQPPHSAS